MVMKDQQKDLSKKRKSIPGNKAAKFDSGSKKPKLGGVKSSDPQSQVSKKPFKPPGQQLKPFKPKFQKPGDGKEDVHKTKHELRIQAKELTEARKKKRKRHYSLEQELASLWEKMRRRNVSKEDRSKFVSEALRKMKGKIHEIAGSHVSSRVLQTCVKYCSQAERDSVFEELQPHFLTLSTNTYAVHLVKKMLDNASKKQLAGFISSLHSRVAALLRHMVGSVVVEHAYELGNAANKQELLIELYSTELQLFRDLVSMKESRLTDVISKLGLQKASVQRHMISVIQPILEKGIVDHSIIHRVLVEYFSIADKSSATDVIQLLCSSLLVRMISTKDGSRIGMLCVKHGSAKGRKQIIKGMKGLVGKIALDRYGSMVLVSILSIVDDTDRIKKIIIRELQAILKELVFDKNGRNPLLQLLHPNCSRYFNPEDLASLNSSIPSLSAKGVLGVTSETKSEGQECNDEETKSDLELPEAKDDENAVEVGKKDPSLRRKELLVDSGLAEKLVDVCTENVRDLLLSNFGKEVLYEVATGGSDGILHPVLDEKLNILHEEIASLVAIPKSDESEEEHVLENFHSSRTIRKLILDCPAFASTLWKTALKGKCKIWAKGHSSKVICAFLESTDPKVRGLVKKELQPLIDEGILKVPEAKQATN